MHSAPEQNQDFWNASEKKLLGFENISNVIEIKANPNFFYQDLFEKTHVL